MIIVLIAARRWTVNPMGKRSDYKKIDRIADNDLNKWCRKIIDTSTPPRRRLRDILRRQARKRIDRRMNEDEEHRQDV